MATFLELNGIDVAATTDEQETLVLALASGQCRREDLVAWLRERAKNLGPDAAV